jgi:hypothetical protein
MAIGAVGQKNSEEFFFPRLGCQKDQTVKLRNNGILLRSVENALNRITCATTVRITAIG